MNANGSGAEPQGAVERAEGPWFFGLLRESGSYRIIAAGPTEGRVRRAMADQTEPTLVANWDEMAGLGIGESERRRWLPQASDATTP